jgi:hypothetical protein
MAEDRFSQFVREVSQDETKLEAFGKDPEGAMDRAGLSRAEKVLLRHGNEELIREALGETGSAALFIVRIFRFGV